MPKKSVGKIFTVEVTSDIEKVSLGSGGGRFPRLSFQDYPSKICCLRVPTISVGVDPLVFRYFCVPTKLR